MSVNESQIKNTTAGAIDDDDAVIFKERKRLLFLGLPSAPAQNIRKTGRFGESRDRKSTRLNSSHDRQTRMPSSA